jgi:hypothetical protein
MDFCGPKARGDGAHDGLRTAPSLPSGRVLENTARKRHNKGQRTWRCPGVARIEVI